MIAIPSVKSFSRKTMVRRDCGFTLIELIVVVLIIGILAAIGGPMYFKSVETSKADDAVTTVQMIATTNKMYSLDNSQTFVNGQVSNGNLLITAGYLASQDWAGKAYTFYACDPPVPGKGTGCGGGSPGNCASGVLTANPVACAQRCAIGASCTNTAPYTGWGYVVDFSGAVVPFPGAPTPPQ